MKQNTQIVLLVQEWDELKKENGKRKLLQTNKLTKYENDDE